MFVDDTTIPRLGIALGIGLLVGIERERSHSADADQRAAGVRTFSLTALLGATSVILGDVVTVIAFGLIVGALVVLSYLRTRNDDPGSASRPFDKDRDGFVMGEGAAVLILEEYERAVSRGAKIYAEIAGFGFSNDAYHMTAPRPDGSQAARSMKLALQDANLGPHEVQYINAHGSSTPLNDPTETKAIKSVFGDTAY